MIAVDLAGAGAAVARYASAIAELPLTARVAAGPGRRAPGPDGAGAFPISGTPAARGRAVSVEVASGDAGWPARVGSGGAPGAERRERTDAAEESGGADGVGVGEPTRLLVAEPAAIAPGESGSLAECGAAVVERVRMPELPAAARDAAAAARAVVVEAALPGEGAAEWLRDAIGWARELAGALEVITCTRVASSLLVALRGRGGLPVTLIAGPTSGPPRIDAHALGEARVAVRIESAGTAIRLATDRGDLAVPADPSAPARRALLRAAEGCDDLPDLIQDERIRALLDRP